MNKTRTSKALYEKDVDDIVTRATLLAGHYHSNHRFSKNNKKSRKPRNPYHPDSEAVHHRVWDLSFSLLLSKMDYFDLHQQTTVLLNLIKPPVIPANRVPRKDPLRLKKVLSKKKIAQIEAAYRNSNINRIHEGYDRLRSMVDRLKPISAKEAQKQLLNDPGLMEFRKEKIVKPPHPLPILLENTPRVSSKKVTKFAKRK